MKYFAVSKNRANIQMHRQQLLLPCQSRKCSYSWFCMADWVGIFLQVELIYREYATRSLHWFVNSYIWNCIYYRYYIIQISCHKYYILQRSQINSYPCYIQGVPKKVTFKMLLEPGCTAAHAQSLCDVKLREGWRCQNGWIFGKVSNSLCPPHPSFRKIILHCFSENVKKTCLKVRNLQHSFLDLKCLPPLEHFQKKIIRFASVDRP